MGCDDGRMAVYRSRWTDDRLDELAERVMRQDVLEVRIDSLERNLFEFRAEMREFRAEMKAEFATMRSEFNGLRGEFNGLRGEFTELRSEFFGMKRWMATLWITGVLAIVAVLVETSLRG
jgi:3-dehydroquinate dehydratase